MAEELVIRLWCDPCMAADVRTEGRPWRGALGDGKSRRIDVCEAHRGPLEAAEALLSEFGRDDDTRSACPECGKRFSTRTLLGSHVRKTHHTTLTAAEAPAGAVLRCPECEFSTVSSSGLVRHTTRKHPKAA